MLFSDGLTGPSPRRFLGVQIDDRCFGLWGYWVLEFSHIQTSMEECDIQISAHLRCVLRCHRGGKGCWSSPTVLSMRAVRPLGTFAPICFP